MALKLDMWHRLLEYRDCSDSDLLLNLIFLDAMSNMRKCQNIRFHGKFCRFCSRMFQDLGLTLSLPSGLLYGKSPWILQKILVQKLINTVK